MERSRYINKYSVSTLRRIEGEVQVLARLTYQPCIAYYCIIVQSLEAESISDVLLTDLEP